MITKEEYEKLEKKRKRTESIGMVFTLLVIPVVMFFSYSTIIEKKVVTNMDGTLTMVSDGGTLTIQKNGEKTTTTVTGGTAVVSSDNKKVTGTGVATTTGGKTTTKVEKDKVTTVTTGGTTTIATSDGKVTVTTGGTTTTTVVGGTTTNTGGVTTSSGGTTTTVVTGGTTSTTTPTPPTIPAVGTPTTPPATVTPPTTGTVTPPAVGIILASNYGVSGSIVETTGTFTNGSNKINVANSNSFAVGHGIAIEGAGINGTLSGWLVTKITEISGNTITIAMNVKATGVNKRVLHDDSAAMQLAVDAVGTTLMIDVPNSYIHNVKLRSNLTVTGSNPTLYAPPYTTNPNHMYSVDYQMFYFSDKKNITISHITFDQGLTRGIAGDIYNGVMSFRSINSENILFSNNKFQNGAYVAGRNYGTQKMIKFYQNTFNLVDTAMHFYGNLVASDITIDNNTVNGGTSEAIAIISGQSSSTSAVRVKIVNNKIYNKKNSTAIFYGGNTNDLEIANNIIDGCSAGIVGPDTLIESAAIVTKNINIHDNVLSNGTTSAIKVSGSLFKITNNKISNFRGDGIGFDTNIISQDIVISGNTINSCGLDGGYAGVRLQSASRVEVIGNYFDHSSKNKEGILMRNNINNITIRNNDLSVSNQVVIAIISDLASFNNLNIYDNKFYGWAVYNTDMTALQAKTITLNNNTYANTPWCFLYK